MIITLLISDQEIFVGSSQLLPSFMTKQGFNLSSSDIRESLPVTQTEGAQR